uniref:Exonuclease domain-containing protein n=1 Tax=Heterorhabditis bacteriophora TaxID=37862 RepID=A0A1I7WMQ2_HETBA
MNARTWEVESRFHHYVRPTCRPDLTTFCTQLTGIIQEMVDSQSTLDEVLQKFDKWMENVGLTQITK